MTGAWSYEEAFSRHEGLITPDEQQRLRSNRVAIAGMGGVGGIHLVTLGRLGIGKFSIADLDTFEAANINRQYGARCNTFGRPKVDVMAEEIRQINAEVELRVFDQGIAEDNVAAFLDGADLLVDGLDFVQIQLRRQLFRQAADNGIFAVTAAPLGFGTAWLNFDPNGMSFDEYFDLHDDQPPLQQLVAFVAGLAPGDLHAPYFDVTKIDVRKKRAPSTGLACQLAAGVAAAESLKILLERGGVECAPCAFQFDAYRSQLHKACLEQANRHPEQLEKRRLLEQMLTAK